MHSWGQNVLLGVCGGQSWSWWVLLDVAVGVVYSVVVGVGVIGVP